MEKEISCIIQQRQVHLFYCFSLLFILDLERPQRQKRWHYDNNFLYILLHIVIHLTAVGNHVINWVVILENEKLKGQSAQILWTVNSLLNFEHIFLSVVHLTFPQIPPQDGVNTALWDVLEEINAIQNDSKSGSQRYLDHELNASSSFTFSSFMYLLVFMYLFFGLSLC